MNPNATNNGGYDPGMARKASGQQVSPLNGPGESSFPVPQFASEGAFQNSPAKSGLPLGNQPSNRADQWQGQNPTTASDANVTTNISVPQESSNLEVEWVDRVERIVNTTTADPYAKSRQLALLKNEFMQKMHGKTIGGEEQK
ncbi:MAG TPA: hypothetical protein VFL85_04180 [Candidatus Saccharimonadales bacterium]|nr:hypothetical protein [Candidatus Saccharimonadales bacterium]